MKSAEATSSKTHASTVEATRPGALPDQCALLARPLASSPKAAMPPSAAGTAWKALFSNCTPSVAFHSCTSQRTMRCAFNPPWPSRSAANVPQQHCRQAGRQEWGPQQAGRQAGRRGQKGGSEGHGRNSHPHMQDRALGDSALAARAGSPKSNKAGTQQKFKPP